MKWFRKNKKVLPSVFLLLIALWLSVPKVYIHELLDHNHTTLPSGNQTSVGSASTEDCDFEKYDKPVYFSIFKFIFSFIPSKAQDDDKVSGNQGKISAVSFAVSLLRGPPAGH